MHIIFFYVDRIAIITHISYIKHTSANGNIKLLCVSSKTYTPLCTFKRSYIFTIPILSLDTTRKELLNVYTWASIYIYLRKAYQLLNFYSNFKKKKKNNILASHYYALNLKNESNILTLFWNLAWTKFSFHFILSHFSKP